MRRIVVLTVVLAGCGSASSSSGPTSPKQTFAGTCGTCHTLKDAGTTGSFGPNLDGIKPSKSLVLATIKKGPGGMPAGLLKGKAADAVATYVSGAAGK